MKQPSAVRAVDKYFADVHFPADAALPQLPRLFQSDWICRAFQEQLPPTHGEPETVRIRHFVHSIGRRALISYEVSWHKERYLPPEYFVAKADAQGKIEFARYPFDARLPGLQLAARPGSALELVNSHVLTMPARRARVQMIRYRPEYRAVLRQRMGTLRLYARVMRPADVAPFLAAQHVAANSTFVVPSLAGCWEEGGIVWLTEIRGRDMRRCIRKGRAPDPMLLIDMLESLWKLPPSQHVARPFPLRRAYARAKRNFQHNLRDHAASLSQLHAIALALDPFVKSWRPTGMAHNDFYDDQLLMMDDGNIALVDLEDIGLGDPLLDVGNFLAHLRWSAHTGTGARAAYCQHFHAELRRAALERLGWAVGSLALREAVCLFRVCTNVIRHPKHNWQSKLDAGLALVNEALG